MRRAGERLPSLGPRGEGWVALQLGLYAVVGAAGLWGPPWAPVRRPGLRRGALVAGTASAVLMGAGVASLGGALTPYPRPRAGAQLRDRGVYALVRHPIYGGVVLAALAWSLWRSPLALAPSALTAAFLDLKSRREERWLEDVHPGYALYRERVRARLLPFVP